MFLRQFVIIIMITLMNGCAMANSEMLNVRPLYLKVVDGETKKPLENIQVLYALHAMLVKKRVLFVLPNIEPDRGEVVLYKQRSFTDKNGEVHFHVQKQRAKKDTDLRKEYLYINLDVDMTKPNQVILKESTESYYARLLKEKVQVDNIDLIGSVALGDKMERNENLLNPNTNFKGLIIISVKHDPNEGYHDWSDKEDKFRVEWNFSSLTKESESIVIELPEK